MTWQFPVMASSTQAELRVNKTPDSYTYMAEGELITYTITLHNDSDQTFTDLHVQNTLSGDIEEVPSLAPGSAHSFALSYLITQHDLESPVLTSKVNAEGQKATGETVSAEDHSTLYRATEGPDITITKNAEPQVFEEVGDTIAYRIFVYNTGTVKLYNIVVTDELTADEWSVTNLAPGDSQGFIAYYTVKQADMDLGYIINVAEVTGEDIEGTIVTDSDDETVVAMSTISQLTITKTANPTEYEEVGDLIDYNIVVVNTGINKIYNIVVTDELTADSWSVTNLAPGDSQGFTATYKVRQSDIDNGEIVNTAEVTGHDIDDYQVYDSDQEIVIAVGRNAEMAFSASMGPTVYSNPGEVIEMEAYVANHGNLTLFDVEVSDSFTGSNWYIASLAPGAERSFSADHTITQSDINAGTIETVVRAESTDPDGNLISFTEEFSSNLLRIPGGLTPDTPFDSEFVIDGLQYYPENSLKVYNRQGTLVFEAAPYQNDWDGTPNRGRVAIDPDGKLPGGTYFYLLKLADDEDPYTGYIYLIKQ